MRQAGGHKRIVGVRAQAVDAALGLGLYAVTLVQLPGVAGRWRGRGGGVAGGGGRAPRAGGAAAPPPGCGEPTDGGYLTPAAQQESAPAQESAAEVPEVAEPEGSSTAPPSEVADDEREPAEAPAPPASTPPPPAPAPAPSSAPAEPEEAPVDDVTAQAKADLAHHLGIPESRIEVVSRQDVTWRDGSLGCPREGEMYTQALVPGYRIVLRAAGSDHHYHGAQGRPPFRCDRPADDGTYGGTDR
jgi:hypothetical protein